MKEQSQFWLTYLTAALGLLIFYGVIRWCRGHEKFTRVLLAGILGFSVFYSVAHIALGKFPQWEGDANYRSECYVAARNNDLPDDHFYRIDSYDCYDNIGLWMEKPCIQFFNSVVTPSIMDFYPRVGVKRDVSSKPDQKLYALRGLLSVEYVVVPQDKMSEFTEKWGAYGYVYDHEDASLVYFRNENYVPMGFTYDKYILLEAPLPETEEGVDAADALTEAGAAQDALRAGEPAPVTLMGLAEDSRSNMLMRAVALTGEQITKDGYLMEEATTADTANLTYEAYVQDAAARRATASTSFSADGTGFTAEITLEKDNLVFFSVPYDEGFTATVNGVEAEIERVDGGLSAVLCPAGENTIVFSYETPGLKLSTGVTLGAILVWLGYCGFIVLVEKKKKQEKH